MNTYTPTNNETQPGVGAPANVYVWPTYHPEAADVPALTHDTSDASTSDDDEMAMTSMTQLRERRDSVHDQFDLAHTVECCVAGCDAVIERWPEDTRAHFLTHFPNGHTNGAVCSWIHVEPGRRGKCGQRLGADAEAHADEHYKPHWCRDCAECFGVEEERDAHICGWRGEWIIHEDIGTKNYYGRRVRVEPRRAWEEISGEDQW
jgi:hypothetical protein